MKRTYLLALLLYCGVTIFAKPGGIFDHVIDVEAYSDWGKGYLTIIDNHIVYDEDQAYYLTMTINDGNMAPHYGYIITALNGKSAKNMTPEQFYALTDTATSFTIKVEDAKGKEYNIPVIVKQEKVDVIDKYSYFELFVLNNFKDSSNIAIRNRLHGSIFNSISDENFDFRKARTYDYVIMGNDPLMDEKILNNLYKFGMERDTENPDILFTIAKNADERVASTYIPPTSRTINTGSQTTAHYNYFTKTYDYVTTQNNRTINEGGYTETTKTANIFLELAALDAKRINDKKMTHAPIIWQMTANRNVTNYNFKITDEYRDYATWGYMPPIDRLGRSSGVLYEHTGLIPDKENPALVAEVIEGSRADKAGFQVGDIVSKIECSYNGKLIYNQGHLSHWWYSYTITSKNVMLKKQFHSAYYNPSANKFKYNTDRGMIEYLNNNMHISSGDVAEFLTHSVKVTIIRNKKKVELNLYPQSKKFSRFFWLNDEQLRQVRN